MASNKTKVELGCGGGLCTTLFVVFLVLKLTRLIDWSWWWVFAPIWIPIASAIGIAVGSFILFISFLGIAVLLSALLKDHKPMKVKPFPGMDDLFSGRKKDG